MTDLTIVLGMHRSGTSICAQALQVLGCSMAEEAGAGPGNPGGHWERFEIAACHDRLLALFGADYHGPTHHRLLPPAWWALPEVRTIKRELQAVVEDVLTLPRPGLKDPRIARLMPLWAELLDDLGVYPRFVVCIRHPAQVARSMAARDGIRQELAELQWLQYNVGAVTGIGRQQVFYLDYDTWFPDPLDTAERLARFLGIPRGRPHTAYLGLRSLIDPTQRHGVSGTPRLEACERLWPLLSEAARQGNITPPLDVAAQWLNAGLSAVPYGVSDLGWHHGGAHVAERHGASS